jgi:hypothetical protein
MTVARVGRWAPDLLCGVAAVSVRPPPHDTGDQARLTDLSGRFGMAN